MNLQDIIDDETSSDIELRIEESEEEKEQAELEAKRDNTKYGSTLNDE